MNKSRNLIIIIILLVLAIGGISFFAFRQVQENKEMSELFAIEKEEMENEYTTFANQYDELQIQINNDSLRQKLENEKLRTQRLLEELRQVKSSNAAEITRLKKELKTVREVMRSYIVQIDSLNRLNEALVTENKAVKEKYTEATRQITSLAEEKKTLNEKVALAAQLDATNISVQAKNKRGKTIEKAKNVKKIAVSFTIVKNITAQTGERIIFI
jgi:chromosome segregation ATPase